MLKVVLILIWFAILFRPTPTHGAPTIGFDPEEGLEIPSGPATQQLLRKLFRNSRELDVTGFHEQETESRHFPPAVVENLGEASVPVIGHDKKALLMTRSISAEEGKDEGVQFAIIPENSTQLAKPEDNLVHLTELNVELKKNEVQVIPGADAGKDRVLGEAVVDVSEKMSSKPIDQVTLPTAQHFNVTLDIPCPHGVMHRQKNFDHNVELTLESTTTSAPHTMLPPPFLVTKQFHGRNYVYQLRYPTPVGMERQPMVFTDKDFTSAEDEFMTGLTGKTVFGPVLPVDLVKLQEEAKKVVEGMPSLPSSTKEDASSSNVFIFFKSFPF